MRNGLEWDQIMAMATAAYNYFQNMSAKESAFFLMYGRDPVNRLSSILNAPRRYLCDDSGLPDLEALKKHVPNGGATTVQLETALHQGQQVQQGT